MIGIQRSAIVLVLTTRAYKEFIQRLFLYLAITATLLCTLALCESVVVILNVHFNIGTIETQFIMAISFPLGYFIMVYALLLCWIGVYVASLTIGIRKRFKPIRYEIIGLAIVTFTPLTLSWLVPVMQDHYCDLALSILVIILLLSVLMVTLSVGAVIFHLCRSGLKCNSSVHVRALKEATPLLTFVVIHQIAVAFLLTYAIALLSKYSDETELPPISLVVLLQSVPAVLFVSIPISLLCQPRIRHGIRCKKKRQQQQSVGVWNPSTGIQDVTSQTHYIVPPETSFTEEDALIIKQ